jgi:hypothetical protein
MARRRPRPLPTGRGPRAQFAGLLGLLGLLWAMGCASHRTTPDATTAIVDACPPDDDGPVVVAPNLDARIGLGGGSDCASSEQCLSGACTLGRCSDWAHATRIAVDTTPAGANVGKDVSGFPLLVRLNGMNFAFGEARPDGADIRFLDSSGNSLAQEIERWDARNAVAEIWVLVPRITGNSRTNAIFLYWGNPLSAASSSGQAVFGDDACVFHMGENPNGNVLQIDDSSGQGNTGAVQTQSAADPRGEGISGSGLALDGQSFLTTYSRLSAPQPMTISLWIKTTSKSGGGLAGFASKTLSDDKVHDRSVAMAPSGRLSFSVLHGGAPKTVTSLSSYNDGRWHFITARFSAAGQYLFVDGEAVADDITLTSADAYQGFWRFGEEPAAAPTDGASDTGVSSGYYLSGLIDEVRVSTSELSDDWIKLSYATQRPGATAVIFPALP